MIAISFAMRSNKERRTAMMRANAMTDPIVAPMMRPRLVLREDVEELEDEVDPLELGAGTMVAPGVGPPV